MIKIKEGNTVVEIGGVIIDDSGNMSISIDGRIITFSNINSSKEKDEDEEEELEEKEDEIESENENEPESESQPRKRGKKTRGRTKQYTDEKLYEDMLQKCVELGHFPKQRDIKNDNDMASVHTYHSRFGSLSNTVDKLGYKLKNGDTTEKMREIIVDFCKKYNVEHGGENMWKVLVENQKKYRKNNPRGGSILKQINDN